MTLIELLLVLKKRFLLIIAGAVIAGVVAIVLSLVWPPKYESQSLLLITKLRSSVTLDPRFETVAEEDIVNLSIQEEQVRRQTLVALAESRALFLKVIDLLGEDLMPDERTVSYLAGVTDVGTVGNLLTLAAQASSPEKAADIANAWAQVYQEQVNRLYSTVAPSLGQIEAELENAAASYEAAKTAYEAFVLESPLEELNRQMEQKRAVLQELETAYLKAARRRVDMYLARAASIEQSLLDAEGLNLQLAGSAETTELSDGELLALYVLEADAFAGEYLLPVTLDIGAGWPVEGQVAVEEAMGRLDHLVATLRSVQAEVEDEAASLSLALLEGDDLLALGEDGEGASRVAEIQGEINALQAGIQALESDELDLLDARALAQDNHLALVRKAAEIEILTDLTGIEVQVAAPAQPPSQPVFPQPLLATVLGVFAGAFAGLALAFALEFWPKLRQ
jgi:uncharacterized protein involved in exopolysaccharide biosynthesis